MGTKTAERSNSFANNFMPLLPERSEFGIKWLNLYNHQVEDGIQDPIVAYEFTVSYTHLITGSLWIDDYTGLYRCGWF